jgi:hypothetical protein
MHALFILSSHHCRGSTSGTSRATALLLLLRFSVSPGGPWCIRVDKTASAQCPSIHAWNSSNTSPHSSPRGSANILSTLLLHSLSLSPPSRISQSQCFFQIERCHRSTCFVSFSDRLHLSIAVALALAGRLFGSFSPFFAHVLHTHTDTDRSMFVGPLSLQLWGRGKKSGRAKKGFGYSLDVPLIDKRPIACHGPSFSQSGVISPFSPYYTCQLGDLC